MDSSNKTKSAMPLALVLGFSAELKKIASGAVGVADVTKSMKTMSPSFSTAKPKQVSVPRAATGSPAPAPDVIASSKTTPPPPVTTGVL